MRCRNKGRQGFTLIEIMITILIIGVLAAVAVPNFRRARERSHQRACYANQKTLAGALEMYNIDANMSVTDVNPAFWQILASQDYLLSIPEDPGEGYGSSSNYVCDSDGVLRCKVHGYLPQTGKGGT